VQVGVNFPMLNQSHVYLIPHTKFNREIKLNRKDIFHRLLGLDVTCAPSHEDFLDWKISSESSTTVKEQILNT